MRHILYLFLFAILISCTKDSKKVYSLIVNKHWVSTASERFFKNGSLSMVDETVAINTEKNKAQSRNELPSYVFDKLIFSPSGLVSYMQVVENAGVCGNGQMTIKDSKWQVEGDELLLEVKGNYLMEGDFHYKMKYQITFPEKNQMILRKKDDILVIDK